MSKPLWEQTDHVCCNCMGRVGRRVAEPGETCSTLPDGKKIETVGGEIVVRCMDCGLEDAGPTVTVKSVCACGIKRQFGFACIPNPAKSPEFPSEFVVGEAK